MISVIVPLYNKEDFVATSIGSILKQSYSDYEILIVNDGSTDKSIDIVKAFNDERIRIINQKNAGVAAARNKGIEEAKGEFIAFLDADDEWKEDYLATQMELVEKYPQCNVFGTNYEFCDSRGTIKPTIIRKIPFQGENGVLTNYFEVASCSHPPLCSSTVMVRKHAIQSIGGFPVGIKSGEDLLTWARLAVKNNIAYCRKVLAIFIDSSHNESFKSKAELRIGGEEYVISELKKLLYTCESIDRKIHIKAYILRWYKIYLVLMLEIGKSAKAISISIEAIKFGGALPVFLPYLLLCFLPFNLPIFLLRRIKKVLHR